MKNDVDLSNFSDEKERSAAYFKGAQSKDDVRKVLRRQVELEIPKGLSRKARKVAIAIRDMVVDYQMAGMEKPESGWENIFTDGYVSTIGGSKAFYHPKDYSPGEGLTTQNDWKKYSISLHVVYDGGLLHDMLSSYSYGHYRNELDSIIKGIDEYMYYEDYANWAGSLVED
jgi:hypothetical protein